MSYPTISARAQRLMLWWGYILMIVFGLSYGFLIKLLPLNPATDTAEQVAAFYRDNAVSVRIGAVISPVGYRHKPPSACARWSAPSGTLAPDRRHDYRTGKLS